MKTCDIIIPTYNGSAKLKRHVIPALRAQNTPYGWEVRIIICDDGSEKPYRDQYTWAFPWQPPRLLALSRGGRSRARNAGINESQADILLFLADDIVVQQGALAAHLLFHEHHNNVHEGALGYIQWDPTIEPTPFMDWMMHGGQQNDYDAILGLRTCDASKFFYGSFVSVKRAFLGKDRFSEALTTYGWEDLEFGSRLAAKGLSLSFVHDARALHRHMYSAAAILTRQYFVGTGATNMNTTTTRRIRHALYWVLGARFLIRIFMRKYGNRINSPWLFQYVTAGEFWYGVYSQAASGKRQK